MGNLEAVQSVYEAFAKGDVPAVLGFLDPNIAWTGRSPYAGTYHGPKAVLEGVFMRLGTEWIDFSCVPTEFIDGGDAVVVLGEYSGEYKTTSKSFAADFAHVWKIQEGKAIKFVQFVDTLLVDKALHA
jgi:uncharacterized protein